MLFFLIEFLQNFLHLKVPAVFTYTSTRMVLASMTGLLATIFTGKAFIRKLYEWKIGDRVRSEDCPLLGELHKSKNNTPTMGGILILFSLFLSLFLWMNLYNPFTLILFLTMLVVGSLGASDDYLKLRRKNTKGLSARAKFLIQIIFSAGIAIYLLTPAFADNPLALRLYVPFLKNPFIFQGIVASFLMGLFFIFVITGASNAVNLTDGLDGLASGCIIFAASSFALIAFISNNLEIASYLHIPYIEGSSEIAVFLAALVGSAIGFLWYNGYPAQVFMGDTGSLTLGAILGVCSVLLRKELLLGIIGGVFVLEALSVILQVGSYKLRNKKRIFLCAPIHHHFEYKGWSEPKVVLRFWIVGLLFALIGIASLKFQ